MHLDAVLIPQGLQERLHGTITVVQAFGHGSKIPFGVFEEFWYENGLTAA